MDAVWIIVGVAGLVALWAIVTFNRLVRLRNECDQGFSGIEVQLKRRADLVPNLVETVKGYAAHESQTFERVTEARTRAVSATGIDAIAGADGMMRQALGGIFGLAEAYPDLKADANFRQLQEELVATEDRIAAARRFYNAVVQRFNSRQQSFPDSLVAGSFGFSPRPFYRIEDDGERGVVAVGFDAGGSGGR